MKRVLGVMRNLKTIRSVVLLGSLLCCTTLQAPAALLGVGGNTNVWPGVPNLFSQTLTVQYTASNGLFTASGSTSDYFDLNTNDNLVINDYDLGNPGTFSLSATVTTNGTLVSGTVMIGCAAGVYDPSYDPTPIIGPGTLLQGNLTAFGFQAQNLALGTSQFDFEFNVTGGSLASVYGPLAGTVLYTEDYSFNGSFTTSFINGGAGEADTLMMVPEPEPQFLIVLSVLGLCWVAQRRGPLRKG